MYILIVVFLFLITPAAYTSRLDGVCLFVCNSTCVSLSTLFEALLASVPIA